MTMIVPAQIHAMYIMISPIEFETNVGTNEMVERGLKITIIPKTVKNLLDYIETYYQL